MFAQCPSSSLFYSITCLFPSIIVLYSSFSLSELISCSTSKALNVPSSSLATEFKKENEKETMIVYKCWNWKYTHKHIQYVGPTLQKCWCNMLDLFAGFFSIITCFLTSPLVSCVFFLQCHQFSFLDLIYQCYI